MLVVWAYVVPATPKEYDLKHKSFFLANANSTINCCPLCWVPLIQAALTFRLYAHDWRRKERQGSDTRECHCHHCEVTPVTSTHVSLARTTHIVTLNWGRGQKMSNKYEKEFGDYIVYLCQMKGSRKKQREFWEVGNGIVFNIPISSYKDRASWIAKLKPHEHQ